MMFDARTGFLFLGILSLIVALALWTVLFRQRTLALHLWCGGSGGPAAGPAPAPPRGLGRPLPVRGDPVQLSQIVLNVCRNAIDAVADCERREVQVRLREQAGRVLLQVQDSGPGLPPPKPCARPVNPFSPPRRKG